MSRAPEVPGQVAPTVSGPVQLGATLLLLFALTYLVMEAPPLASAGGHLAVLIGFVLLIASLAGRLAAAAGLPRITGFLVVGILAGPSVLEIVPSQAVQDLKLIDEFALALIALLAGGELKMKELRSSARAIGLTTLGVTLVAWIGVAAAVVVVRPLLPFLAELPFRATVAVALLLGVWAANSSPDLTVAVIEETGVKDLLSEVILGVTVVKDVLVIVLFTLTLSLVSPLVGAGAAFDAHVIVELTREVGGALVVGAILGWIFSLYLSSGEERPPIATFLFAYMIVVVSDRFHIELLLTAVAAGFVIENLSEAGGRMIRGIESVSVVIFAFFFAVVGASLDLGAVAEFWHAALILFLARLGLTYLGARAGTRYSTSDERIRARTWQGLVSQGGVTLGLLLLMERSLPQVGSGVVALGTAIIIGNILGGPILLKRALTAEA